MSTEPMPPSTDEAPVTRLPIRVYADTSVFGGVFDEGFEEGSRSFLGQVRDGSVVLVLSAFVREELEPAPEEVRRLFAEMESLAEVAETSDAALDLQAAYLEASIVTAKYATDALHVALATVTGCSVLVSWNLKHIVNFRRIRLYNEVAARHGYAALAIHTPAEVIERDDEGEPV